MASPSPSSSTSSQHRARDGSRSPVGLHRNSPSGGGGGAASNRSSLDLNRSCPSAGAAKTAQAGDRPSSALDMSRPASAWSLDGSASGGTPGKSNSSSLQQNNQDRYSIAVSTDST